MSDTLLPVSSGEALDKYSILSIKKSRISDADKLKDIEAEMALIQPALAKVMTQHAYQYQCLYNLNLDIWNLTDEVRTPGLDPTRQAGLFHEIFQKNDARFRVKSKLNRLVSSSLKEQKSYASTAVTLAPALDFESYQRQNGHIRYLAVCYDMVIVLCPGALLPQVASLFKDDPYIRVTSDPNQTTKRQISLDDAHEPIHNLKGKYEFSHVPPRSTMNYICGGRLGDLIHALYVIKGKHAQTGLKGHLYVTGDLKWGGDHFGSSAKQTHAELYPIVMQQPYMDDFSLYENQLVEFDVNLNAYRMYPRLFQDSWLEIMSNSFGLPVVEQPWVSLSTDPKYKDTILIHRSLLQQRHVPMFLQFLEVILRNNRCLFITCNQAEYEGFPLKHLVPLDLKKTLGEMYAAINSCKFFIGNQSAPLAMAYSLFKPLLCESSEGEFYTHKRHYQAAFWFCRDKACVDTLLTYVDLTAKDFAPIPQVPFFGQFDTDRYIAEYFPATYKGTCVDVGMAEPTHGNNSYHFERMGWNCLCIEPNPTYYRQGVAAGRKVENVACGAVDADDVLFEIFTLAGGTNQGAISSLKRDDRLVQSHAHIISRVDQVPVKVRTLDAVLAQHPEITSIDFISIDTENTELDVLKGFDINRWKPKLLVIENNFDEPFLGDYLKQFGYVRDKKVQINDFFIPVKPVQRYVQFHGELQDGKCVDQTLREYFPDYDYKGVFFDVGAYEPINISNSYHFEKNGWDVHCFEANTQRIPELKSLRKNVYNYAIYDSNADSITFNVVNAIWGGGSLTAGISAVQLDPRYMKEFGHGIRSVVEIKVPQKTLNTLIEEEIKVDHIDILSIDVEGGELKVLKGLNLEKYKPKVILVEDVFGDKDLHEYLVQHGYRLDKAVKYNKYYVPQ